MHPIYTTLFLLSFSKQAHAESAATNFGAALRHVEHAQAKMEAAVDQALALNNRIESIHDQIAAAEEQIEALQTQAKEIAMMANRPMPPPGGGGPGGGQGNQSNGNREPGNGDSPQTPQLPEIPNLEFGQAPSSTGSLDSLASLGSGPSRGFSGGGDFPQTNGFQVPQVPNNPYISPATVAANGVPQLTGKTSAPTPNPGPGNSGNSSAPNSSPGSTGGGMGGSGSGSGNASNSGATDGGSMASVGMTPPEGEEARPRIEAMQAGAGGSGGEGGAGASEAAIPSPDGEDSPVKAQINKGSSETALAGKEKILENPEGKGLMGWVGWVDQTCKASSTKGLLGICSVSPTTTADTGNATLPLQEVSVSERAPASAAEPKGETTADRNNAVPPRDGILGLLSGQ